MATALCQSTISSFNLVPPPHHDAKNCVFLYHGEKRRNRTLFVIKDVWEDQTERVAEVFSELKMSSLLT